MQRQSQEALDLLTVSDEIVNSIETHGVEVAGLLEEKWATMPAPPDSTPQVDGPRRPDFLGHMYALRDGLNVSANSVAQADQVHVYHLARLIELRDESRELKESLYTKFSTARRAIDELHGEGKAFVMAAIQGPTARTSKKLLRQIDVTLPRLFDPDLKQSQPKVDGITVDPMAMGRDIEELAKKLRATYAEFRRTRRLVQASRKEKLRRMKEHRTSATWTARIVEGYYQLAGEAELAERLRPAVARGGRPPASPTPEPGPAPEESAPDNGANADSAPESPSSDETVPDEGTSEGLSLPVLNPGSVVR